VKAASQPRYLTTFFTPRSGRGRERCLDPIGTPLRQPLANAAMASTCTDAVLVE
jgi:hypothetical protein